MEKESNRTIPLDDSLLFAMVEQKGTLVEEGRALAKKIEDAAAVVEKLESQMESIVAKVNKQKLSIMKRIEKLTRSLLGEFDIPVTTEIRDGKVVLLVTDAMAEFRNTFSKFNKYSEPVPRKQK
jgi:hypothetical protein